VVAQAAGGVVVVVKLWARQKGGGHYPNAGSSVGSSVQTGSPTGGSRTISVFSNLSKTGSTCKIEMESLSYSKNSQFLHDVSVEYSKQLSQLCQLHIPNRNKVTNPGTDSIFEHLMNFKRDSIFLEKSDKFFKIPS
jgi:hypothetical protein